jgi:hypothetical protein
MFNDKAFDSTELVAADEHRPNATVLKPRAQHVGRVTLRAAECAPRSWQLSALAVFVRRYAKKSRRGLGQPTSAIVAKPAKVDGFGG